MLTTNDNQTTPTAKRFKAYANDAFDRVSNDLCDNGLESEVAAWMREDEARRETLTDHLDAFAHRSILARGDVQRSEAVDQLLAGLKPWVEKFIAGWDDGRRDELMADVDEDTRVARILDREEGAYL